MWGAVRRHCTNPRGDNGELHYSGIWKKVIKV